MQHGIFIILRHRFLYGDLVRSIHNMIRTTSAVYRRSYIGIRSDADRPSSGRTDQPTDRQTVISSPRSLARLVIVTTSPSVDHDDECGSRIDPVAELDPLSDPPGPRTRVVRQELLLLRKPISEFAHASDSANWQTLCALQIFIYLCMLFYFKFYVISVYISSICCQR